MQWVVVYICHVCKGGLNMGIDIKSMQSKEIGGHESNVCNSNVGFTVDEMRKKMVLPKGMMKPIE